MIFNIKIDKEDKFQTKEKSIEINIATRDPRIYKIATPPSVVVNQVFAAASAIIWRNIMPLKAPTTIEPSSAMLIIPEHSEYIPPNEPRIKPTK